MSDLRTKIEQLLNDSRGKTSRQTGGYSPSLTLSIFRRFEQKLPEQISAVLAKAEDNRAILDGLRGLLTQIKDETEGTILSPAAIPDGYSTRVLVDLALLVTDDNCCSAAKLLADYPVEHLKQTHSGKQLLTTLKNSRRLSCGNESKDAILATLERLTSNGKPLSGSAAVRTCLLELVRNFPDGGGCPYTAIYRQLLALNALARHLRSCDKAFADRCLGVVDVVEQRLKDDKKIIQCHEPIHYLCLDNIFDLRQNLLNSGRCEEATQLTSPDISALKQKAACYVTSVGDKLIVKSLPLSLRWKITTSQLTGVTNGKLAPLPSPADLRRMDASDLTELPFSFDEFCLTANFRRWAVLFNLVDSDVLDGLLQRLGVKRQDAWRMSLEMIADFLALLPNGDQLQCIARYISPLQEIFGKPTTLFHELCRKPGAYHAIGIILQLHPVPFVLVTAHASEDDSGVTPLHLVCHDSGLMRLLLDRLTSKEVLSAVTIQKDYEGQVISRITREGHLESLRAIWDKLDKPERDYLGPRLPKGMWQDLESSTAHAAASTKQNYPLGALAIRVFGRGVTSPLPGIPTHYDSTGPTTPPPPTLVN